MALALTANRCVPLIKRQQLLLSWQPLPIRMMLSCKFQWLLGSATTRPLQRWHLLFRILIGTHGIASQVMQLLYAEYMPQDCISHIEADRRYDSIHLDEHMHPRYLRSIFAQIEAEFPHAAADEAKKMSIIFRVSPQSYASVLTAAQKINGENCTSKPMIVAMETLYRQQHNAHDGDQPRGNCQRQPEVGMSAPAVAGAARVCHNCGHAGHMAAQCHAPFSNFRFRPGGGGGAGGRGGGAAPAGHENGAGGRGIGNGAGHNNRNQICGECGGRGHSTQNCFCLAANATRRPAGWTFPPGYQPHREQAAANINGDGFELMLCHLTVDGGHQDDDFELLLCQVDPMDSHWDSNNPQDVPAMTFPSKQGLLYDPNIWLADSAASTHSTAHLQGMTNLQAGTSANAIQVGNATMNQVQFIGDIPGTFFVKSGNYIQSSTLHQVSFSCDGVFNLLSFPQLMMQGWSIAGARKGLVATNPDGTIEIPFGIVIHTNAGCVFATCFKCRMKSWQSMLMAGKNQLPRP
jgi:hypothetical protein